MKCIQCGYENEMGANFCKQCGMNLTESHPVDKGKKEFVPDAQRRTDEGFLCFGEEKESKSGGFVTGVIFIFIALIMALFIFTNILDDLGTNIGNFFGDFGETMGRIGEGIGSFFGNFGETFGNFFGGFEWWTIIELMVVLIFFLLGIIILYQSYRRQR